jgi:hypothetical protein
MARLVQILILLLSLVTAVAYAANVRTAGPFSGSLRGGTVTLLDDGRIVVLSGDTVSIWDPHERQWLLPQLQRQPRRYLHTATLVGNDRIVFAGGIDASDSHYGQQTALSSVTFWHGKQNVWESGPSLLGPRFAHAAVALANGDVLVIGGAPTADRDEPFGPFLATVERLDDKTTAQRAPMQFARVRHTATVLPDGHVMVIGGLGDDRKALASVEIYDPNTNTWQPAPPLATARQGHTATLLPDGRVFVAGGADSDGKPVARAEVWSKELGVWHDAGELLAPRSRHAATLLKDGNVLLSGGVSHGISPARTLERWNSVTNEWTVAGEMSLEMRDHHAAVQPDGSVLLFGGDSYEQGGSVVLVWLPGEEENQHIDNVSGASLTELRDGRVLLAGGSRRQSSSVAVSIYDPKTDRWVAASPMHFARFGHRAVRFPDGRVLVAGGGERGEGGVPGEIWDPETGRWTVTEDVSAIAGAPRTELERHTEPQRDQLKAISPDTRWSSLVGLVTTMDGQTYAFRNADLPGRTFSRLGVVRLNTRAQRWEPNTEEYVERESPAMLALSDTEIMVAGGASAVVQILNTATNKWRYTGWLPAPVRAPSILSLQDGNVMLAGRVMDTETTVVCALWNPDTNTWAECGRFTDDAGAERRAPVLRNLGSGQTLLVYGNEHALVRGQDGTWVATKLDFPKDNGVPYLKDEGVSFTSNLGSVWNPLEKAWVDATDVFFIHRRGMQALRTPDRRWIFASRDDLLQWQPQDRVLSQPRLIGATERHLSSVALVDNDCAVLWNNSRELFTGIGLGAYMPAMYAYNFATHAWSSRVDAPAAPLNASALVTRDHKVVIAGIGRDAVAGGAAWGQFRVSCDKALAFVSLAPNPPRALYLPVRPPRPPKDEPAKAVVNPPPPPDLTYMETWKVNVLSIADSVRRHIRSAVFFGGLVFILLMRLATRFGVYVVNDDGSVPGRIIDLAMLGVAACVLLGALGAPWAVPRAIALMAAASVIVFAAQRLWTNIESVRGKVLYGVPLGASVVVAALAIGGITIGYLSSVIDSLRDY